MKPSYRIVHHDETLLVVDKRAGVLTVAAPGRRERCVLDDLRRDGLAVAPVHRLDKETSGLLLLCLDRERRDDIQALFRERAVEKEYLALVLGVPSPRAATIDVPIRDLGKTARVDRRGARAVTHYEVLERVGERLSLVRLRIDTGRHNQIRIHLAHVGHPLLGDRKYGARGGGPKARRTMLHASRLAFPHPATGERLDLRCEPPDDFAAARG